MQGINCLCTRKEETRGSPTAKCARCHSFFHLQCYGITHVSSKPILCFQCRISKINPFVKITKFLLPPFRVPRSSRGVSFTFQTKDYWDQISNKSMVAVMYIVDLGAPLPEIFSTDISLNISINKASMNLSKDNCNFINVGAHLVPGTNTFSAYYQKDPVGNVAILLGLLVDVKSYEEVLVAIPKSTMSQQKVTKRTNEDLATTAEKINLLCPLTLGDLQYPGRGSACKHIACFDVKNYLINNNTRGHNKWKCPICTQHVFWDDLYLDTTIAGIVDEVKKKYESCEDIEIEINIDGSWIAKIVEKEGNSPDPGQCEPMADCNDKPKEKRMGNEELSEIATKIVTLQRTGKIKESRQELKSTGLLEKAGPTDMAFIIRQCNLIPRQCMRLFLEPSKPTDQETTPLMSYKEVIKRCLASEAAFITVIKAWEKPIQDLAKLAARTGENITDRKNAHLQMLGMVSALAYLNTTYTPGALCEKVLGLAVAHYATECGFNSAQIAKAIDLVTQRFCEFDLPSKVTMEKFREDREGYFKTLVSFYASALSVLPVKVAGEVFSYLFAPPAGEIKDPEEVQFHKGMEAFFLRRLVDTLGYSTVKCAEFIEIWDSQNHLKEFLRKIEKLHSYGFTIDTFTKSIVKSSSTAIRNYSGDSLLAKLLL